MSDDNYRAVAERRLEDNRGLIEQLKSAEADLARMTADRDSFKLGMAMANQGWQETQRERDALREMLAGIAMKATAHHNEMSRYVNTALAASNDKGDD